LEGQDTRSGQRIRHELDLILDEERAVAMFSRLSELGFLEAISPSLKRDDGLVGRLNNAINAPSPREFGELSGIANLPRRQALGYLVWLLPLPLKGLRAVSKKLRFQAALKSALLSVGELFSDSLALKDAKISEWTTRLEQIAPLALYAAFLCPADEVLHRSIGQYLSKSRHVQPTLGGDDLQERGLKPGPRYREILTRLRAAWLDGEIKTPEEEISMLERLIKRSDN
jgi:tRNA nucleotidyltransferase (CCA-adding enzyme)